MENINFKRTLALSLALSVVEYASPAWFNGAHIEKIDVELNVVMSIITGTVKSTTIP